MVATRLCGVAVVFAVASSLLAAENDPADGKLAFGRRQVEQLLDDRPDMRDVLPASHPLFKWVVEGFNGDRFGRRVYWLADSPRAGYPSMFIPPYGEIPPFIQVTAGAELTPVDRWASVIFELHNLEGFEKADKLVEQAMSGKLSGEEYATECVRLEYDASLRAKQQFLKDPIPEAQHKRNPIYHQILSLKPKFEEYRKELESAGKPVGNYEYFLDHHRRVLAPAIEAANDSDKVPTP